MESIHKIINERLVACYGEKGGIAKRFINSNIRGIDLLKFKLFSIGKLYDGLNFQA